MQTFEKMKERLEGSLRTKRRRANAAERRSMEVRATIRALKRTLISDGRIPSIAAIRERVTLEEHIDRLRAIEEKFTAKIGGFSEFSSAWRDMIARKKQLASEVLSESDKSKLNELERLFTNLEELFGFKSFPVGKLSISRDHYRPTREGFDVVYDVSASDNIRTICAYVLSLLELARSIETNHPGLVILDEPRQQNLDWSHFRAVLARASECGSAGQQVIVATSDSIQRVEELQRTVACHCVSFSGKMLKRKTGDMNETLLR
jgi:hypothetical protein